MKKIIIGMALVLGGMCFGGTTADYVDVYDVKMSVKVPYLERGVRTYKTQSFAGLLTVGYSDAGVETASMEIKNKKTGVIHEFDMTGCMYNLLGKGNKQIARNVPTVSFVMEDEEGDTVTETKDAAHETIVKLAMAGTGTVKSTKITSGGCGACGDTTVSTYCTKLTTMSGSLVGVMNCSCPEDEYWAHTVLGSWCGLADYFDDLSEIRTRDASIWGSWSAKWNKKLTEAAN